MIMKLEPIFKETLWGGEKLKTRFGFKTPYEKTGEVWCISGLKDQANRIENTTFSGKTLYDLWQEERHLFGGKEGDYFPILVKLIDANQDLSIQVHPDNAKAREKGSLGKTECWTILDCEKDSTIIIGHNASTLDELKTAIEEKRVLDIVNEHPIKKDDFFFIDAGTLHAIKGGTLLLEVQQSSDITYRFYDYERLDNGKPRPLHIDEALEVVKVPDRDIKTALETKYFDILFVNVAQSVFRKSHQHGDFVTVLDGEGYIDNILAKKGMSFFISSQTAYQVTGNVSLAIALIM